ncbi:hypothetical protein PMAYCL1PPCAC_25765, partial [Pristionchus mayeri]
FLLHVAWSCVPVRPGEDMPCPSAPEAASAPGYTKKPFTMTTESGSKVLSCTQPATLIKVDGGTVTTLPQAAKIICKPNSGKYVINDGTGDKEIGSEKYTCGEATLACQTCDQTKLLDQTNTNCNTQMDIMCKAKPFQTVMEGADKCPVLSCTGTDKL